MNNSDKHLINLSKPFRHIGNLCLDFGPLPNDKFLDVTKLKAFAGDKLNVAKMAIFLIDRAENTVGKGENAGYQHYLLPQCFLKLSSLGSLKVRIMS